MVCENEINFETLKLLQTRGETRCPRGVSVSCLASRTRHECPRHKESVDIEA